MIFSIVLAIVYVAQGICTYNGALNAEGYETAREKFGDEAALWIARGVGAAWPVVAVISAVSGIIDGEV